jgi:hypothetical protein
MTCRDVNLYLDQGGGAPIPPEILEHAATCPGCRKLLEAFQRAGSAASTEPLGSIPLPKDLLDDLRPVRPLPSPGMQLAIWLGAGAVVSAIGVWLWGLSGWQAQPDFIRAIVVGSIVALLGASAYGLTVQMVPGSARRFSFFGVEIIAFLVFAATVAMFFHRQYPFPLAPVNRGCFLHGLVISGVAALFLLPRMRRGVWLDREATAINAGVFISSICLLVFALYCPVLNLHHVFTAHLGAIAVVMLVSWLISIAWRRISF